jgi:hypothetical protein
MVLKNNKIFYSKALQILPELVFWFENKPSGNPGQKELGRVDKSLKSHQF